MVVIPKLSFILSLFSSETGKDLPQSFPVFFLFKFVLRQNKIFDMIRGKG